jgi:S1-C subfamily serine protease
MPGNAAQAHDGCASIPMLISEMNVTKSNASSARSAPVALMAVLLMLLAAALLYVVMTKREVAPERPVATGHDVQFRPVVARGDLAEDEHSTIQLFSETSPSVVHVTSLMLRRSRRSLNVDEIPQGAGSGFIWDDKGHIVTNFHVIKDGGGAEVTLHDNTVWKAKIVGRAPDKDLAVLKIMAPAEVLRPLAIGTSSNLQVGQKVFAIGNPFGLDQTLTTGIISGLGREIQSLSKRPIQDVIQTDAAINPGNSGGPLLDSAGRLIGVNTAILSTSGGSAGVGFAVPVDTINRIVPQLIAHGAVIRPGLGVQIGTDQLARRVGVNGVIVWDVPPKSAAEQAGLMGVSQGRDSRWVIGDVITGIDEVKVTVANDLFRILDKHQVGDEVKLRLVNQGVEREIELRLQSLP